MSQQPFNGDSPCDDCGTDKNIVWFTDNCFWNDVMKTDKEKAKILCVDCFVIRAEKKYKITGWRLLPNFEWIQKNSTKKIQ